jgi:hypothetical protein
MIPLVKQWFQSLDLEERVLAVTTIDSKINETIKEMYQTQKKMSNSFTKFRMQSSMPAPAQI